MKYTASVITAALDLYFKGLSIRSIADHLNQMHAYQISYPTVYRWIRKYSLKIANYTDGLKPKITSHTWHADEMRLNVNGQPRNLWNLMDHKTRYLLTNQVTKRKGSHEAKHLLAAGLKKSNPTNIDLITDALASYGKAVTDTKTNGVKFRHFEDSGLTKHQSNNRLERLNGSVRQRLKTMRGMDNDQSSKIFTRGFAAYYNFICPHSALGGRTPAQAAGLELNLHHNKWLSLIRKTWERS
jgi:transposase-like protein